MCLVLIVIKFIINKSLYNLICICIYFIFFNFSLGDCFLIYYVCVFCYVFVFYFVVILVRIESFIKR